MWIPPPAAAPREGAISVFCLAVLIAPWLGLAGRWHWMLDLFSHFQGPYLLASLTVLAWAVWRRRRRLWACALLTSLLVGGQLVRVSLPMTADRAASPTLRVISLNVLTDNPDKARVLAYLKASEAEVVFLMEVDAEWAAALEPLRRSHPHHHLEPRQDNFGLALFSRLPLQNLRLLRPADGPPAVQAELVHEGRSLVFLGAHPPPPLGGRLAALRDAQLGALARQVAELDRPVLLAGDLNATPWSQALRLLAKAGLTSRHPAWPPTWRAGSIFALPIDHAFVTPPLVLLSRRTGPNVGSDHRPLELELGWP